MQWAQGAEATHQADFVAQAGGPLDVTDVIASVRDPGGIEVAVGAGVETAPGSFTFTWTVPEDAEVSPAWRIVWSAEANGSDLGGTEFFEITPPGGTVIWEPIMSLRNLVDRQLPTMTEDDLFFTNDELHTLLMKNGQSETMAAYEGWVIKAAVAAEQIDNFEGGAERRMSQKFRNAMTLANHFKEIASASDRARLRSVRVVGKVVNLRQGIMDPLGIYDVPLGGDVDYVRTYPLKRFPAILG